MVLESLHVDPIRRLGPLYSCFIGLHETVLRTCTSCKTINIHHFDGSKKIMNYHCRSAMICRDDLELRWRLLMCENEFSHISLLLYICTAF